VAEKIIWQPEFSAEYGFAVSLDKDAAIDFIKAKIPAELQKRMNELAKEEILKKIRRISPNPYIFHENSALITGVYLGDGGVWLATDRGSIDSLLKEEKTSGHIKYHSHNVDHLQDAFILLKLFGLWSSYYEIMTNKK